MITVGKWRYALLVGLPVAATAVLVHQRKVQLSFPGEAILQFSGDPAQVDIDLQSFRGAGPTGVTFDRVIGHPLQLRIQTAGAWPKETAERLRSFAQAAIQQSLTLRRDAQKKTLGDYQTQTSAYETRFTQLQQERKTMLMGSYKRVPNAAILEKVETLKARRRQLIDNYPTHADIPLLAKQIQDLLGRVRAPSAAVSDQVVALDRQMTEAKVRMDYFGRLLKEGTLAAKTIKPPWRIQEPIALPRRPTHVEGLPILLGAYGIVFLIMLGVMVVERRTKTRQKLPMDGLWSMPKKDAEPAEGSSEPSPAATVEAPVALEVVSPELPSDPLTEKAASLYARWMEVAKLLYTPSAQAPEGVLDSVGPLLQESSEFLPSGHDVLARYLARSVEPGHLPAHVARTVLMALTGAEEAGVSPEHRLAMALAALFHDLAVVPRPSAQQDEAGSEVGRLSAVLLRRIPGLQPALLSMVEDILIGMDEFKMETWHNVSQARTLEPLSKVLREIDRFEKVMQKQKSRLDRQLKAANG